ncbi:DUF1127 domain-containing protein [Paracoccus aerodenitrificans]|uniref:DUF1127 domain-containing protein n=1 Tax=Paracoccus aerodenitrificans TaxID=3017781 RepID=UPI0022F09B43|nr:DUF1127 domain-containing protein [Paracoccus aerodenitrificans]WBU62827.1 DUF1127 domain-containing protein [Paracoccus aerodenitrificans]
MTTMNIDLPMIRNPFARLASSLRNRVQRMQTRAELERLSDRELHDIGLNRADIDTVVNSLA